MDLNKIHCGDCQMVMRDIDRNSVDCIVTDPPYQLSSPNTKNATKGFMGKSWDICPSVEIWQECLRVLKPGAFAFVMCIPRQDCLARMICRLEDAGFNVAFSSIYHTFASGFPKAQNLSKQADKRNGKPQRSVELEQYLREKIYEKYKTHTILAKEMGIAESLIRHWIGKCGNQFLIPPLVQYQILKEKCNLDSRFDELISWEEAKREVIGKKRKARAKGQKSALPTLGAKTEYIDIDITNSTTPQAKALEGGYSGMQLKPAVEIVIVAMKPLSEKTYLDQAIANGQGCTWLDDARIPYKGENDIGNIKRKIAKDSTPRTDMYNKGLKKYNWKFNNNKGRFPANVLCEDNVLDDGRLLKPSIRPNIEGKLYSAVQSINFYGDKTTVNGYPDEGSFSRYFSLDAWFAERIKLLPKEAQMTFPFMIIPKPSKSEKDRGLKGESNIHPTCKNIKLMSWLITLASREGDIVLDPFCGSGTTLIAAKMLGRQYIGIEREVDYCEIARKRVAAIPSSLSSF